MSSLLTNSLLDSKIAAEASSAVGGITSGADARDSDPSVVVKTLSGGRRRRKSSKVKKSKARNSNKKRRTNSRRSSRSYRRPLFLL